MTVLPHEQCQRRGCPNNATAAVRIIVPVARPTKESPQSVAGLIGVILCEDHLATASAEEFIDAAGDTIKPVLQMAVGVSLASPEFALLQTARRQGCN